MSRQMAADRNLPGISVKSSVLSQNAQTTPFPPWQNPDCQPVKRTQKLESAAQSGGTEVRQTVISELLLKLHQRPSRKAGWEETVCGIWQNNNLPLGLRRKR